ncbi:peptidase M20, partial [mine drainage metagenome]
RAGPDRMRQYLHVFRYRTHHRQPLPFYPTGRHSIPMIPPAFSLAQAESFWHEQIFSALVEYIRIPNRSPAFDPDWKTHGAMDRAIRLACNWCQLHLPPHSSVEIRELPGRTPLLYFEVPAHPTLKNAPPIFFYGHLDKQPEFEGWREGLGAWTPILENGRLYGRGGADD